MYVQEVPEDMQHLLKLIRINEEQQNWKMVERLLRHLESLMDHDVKKTRKENGENVKQLIYLNFFIINIF